MKTGIRGRIIGIYIFVVIFMFGAVLRVFSVASDDRVKASINNNTYRLKLTDTRKTVFDYKLKPITNEQKIILAVVSPTPRAIIAIQSVCSAEAYRAALEILKNGKPAVVELQKQVECEGVMCVELYRNSSAETLCPQLIGYLDEEGKGVTGVQAAFNEQLSGGEITALMAADGTGGLLLGARPQIEGDFSVYGSGIALTVDSDIQKIVQQAMLDIKSGAAVISDVKTGEIRAMVSMPQFDLSNVGEYLSAENSPFINRALKSYNVGSVFKPCVAAAMIENESYLGYTVECGGSAEISGHTFKCHKLSGHGVMDLKSALMYSCNVFFYNAACRLSGRAVYNSAAAFMFGNSIDLSGIKTDKGSITPPKELEANDRAVANLSIGQGELLLSPVSLLPLYQAIANGGIYNTPTIIKGSVENGKINESSKAAPTRAFSSKTADILKEYLSEVVLSGTGTQARPELCTAAGKTATAETGWKKDGRLVTNSWFCGFFPLDNPKYVVVVMLDDLEQNGTSAAPVFKRIADGITLFEDSRK